MRRVWATVVAVWATLAILGVLAWTQAQPVRLVQAAPTVVLVKGKSGQAHLVVASTHATTQASPAPRP